MTDDTTNSIHVSRFTEGFRMGLFVGFLIAGFGFLILLSYI